MSAATGAIPRSDIILLVSPTVGSVVARAASRCGLLADVVRDIASAVGRLRRRKYRAVLVDLDASDVDSLELVLNLRDVDEEVPIAVLATTWDAASASALGALPLTACVAKRKSESDLTLALERLKGLQQGSGAIVRQSAT